MTGFTLSPPTARQLKNLLAKSTSAGMPRADANTTDRYHTFVKITECVKPNGYYPCYTSEYNTADGIWTEFSEECGAFAANPNFNLCVGSRYKAYFYGVDTEEDPPLSVFICEGQELPCNDDCDSDSDSESDLGCGLKLDDMGNLAVDLPAFVGDGLKIVADDTDDCDNIEIDTGCGLKIQDDFKLGLDLAAIAGCGLKEDTSESGCSTLAVDTTESSAYSFSAITAISAYGCGIQYTVTPFEIKKNACGVAIGFEAGEGTTNTLSLRDDCCGDCPRYDCYDGSCVEAAEGFYATAEECAAQCYRYDCVEGNCVQTEGGDYATLELCQAACTHWECVDGTCVPDVDGFYGTEAECIEQCSRYNCVDFACVQTEGGDYATLEACEAACSIPWSCVDGTCVEDEEGIYGDEAECISACDRYSCVDLVCVQTEGGTYASVELCETGCVEFDNSCCICQLFCSPELDPDSSEFSGNAVWGGSYWEGSASDMEMEWSFTYRISCEDDTLVVRTSLDSYATATPADDVDCGDFDVTFPDSAFGNLTGSSQRFAATPCSQDLGTAQVTVDVSGMYATVTATLSSPSVMNTPVGTLYYYVDWDEGAGEVGPYLGSDFPLYNDYESTGTYTISVRAVDDCGRVANGWSYNNNGANVNVDCTRYCSAYSVSDLITSGNATYDPFFNGVSAWYTSNTISPYCKLWLGKDDGIGGDPTGSTTDGCSGDWVLYLYELTFIDPGYICDARTVKYTATSWDGLGCKTFTLISNSGAGSPPSTVDVCCV